MNLKKFLIFHVVLYLFLIAAFIIWSIIMGEDFTVSLLQTGLKMFLFIFILMIFDLITLKKYFKKEEN